MNVYMVTSENIKKCSDCIQDINKSDIFYMISLAQNKNNGINFYLCKECKDKLKNILNVE